MPDVRTYRAATMREALDRVRAELGREAVILATRQVPVRRLLPWGQREEVEITAGLGIETKPIAKPRPRVEARRAETPRSPQVSPPIPRLNESERRAAEIVKELQKRQIDSPFTTAMNGTAHRLDFTTPDHVSFPFGGRAGADALPTPNLHRHLPGALPEGEGTSFGPSTDLTRRLDAIERMLAELGRRHQASADVPADLLGLYDRLIAADVEDSIARDLVERLKRETPADRIADVAGAQTGLVRLVESEIRCGGPIAVKAGGRKVVALVGPTGVGKTTTLAKLAANFRLRDGLRTGLVTVDTYRIAAVDQLRTYAEIIDLPMKVVTTPAEMRTALDELAGLDLVLIDTAGRSPRDAAQIAELGDLLAAARPDETHLVLSLTAGGKALAGCVERFKAVSPTAAIVTKLDEADGAGPILSLSKAGGLPVSYVTNGQDVPDDIEPARAGRIAAWIAGESRIESRESREERSTR